MGVIASQITSLTIVYSIVYSGTDQRKHQSSASLAFVQGIHREPVNSSHKGPVTWFPFDDVIMSFWKVSWNVDWIVNKCHVSLLSTFRIVSWQVSWIVNKCHASLLSTFWIVSWQVSWMVNKCHAFLLSTFWIVSWKVSWIVNKCHVSLLSTFWIVSWKVSWPNIGWLGCIEGNLCGWRIQPSQHITARLCAAQWCAARLCAIQLGCVEGHSWMMFQTNYVSFLSNTDSMFVYS